MTLTTTAPLRESRSAAGLATAAAWLFILSTLFPLAASVVPAGQLPRWIGPLDVIVALMLVMVCIAVDHTVARHVTPDDQLAAARVYRSASHVLLVLLTVFFVAGSRVDWNVLVPGLAWRAWLFIYALPAVQAARRARA